MHEDLYEETEGKDNPTLLYSFENFESLNFKETLQDESSRKAMGRKMKFIKKKGCAGTRFTFEIT